MRIAVTILVLCAFGLLTLGTVMLCSAPAGFLHNNFEKQLAFCVLGFMACILAACWDYGVLKKVSWPLYILAVLALVAVLVVGVTRGGARRWFNLGFMLFQPSELAKVALIIALAHYAEWNHRQMDRFRTGLLVPALLSGLMLGLILVEPDFGSAILLGAVAGVMLFVVGVPMKHLAPTALAGMILVGTFIYLDPMRRGRVMGSVQKGPPTAELKDVRYQGEQSKIAIGSGGLTGFGLGEGLMKMGRVPENHTDFIGSVIGEELGLAATLPLTLAYLAIFLSGLYISTRARDPFGTYLGLGLTFLIGLQAIINIGVVTDVLPNKGLPLPLVSYGGSSLVMTMASVGLLLNIARHAAEPEPAFAEPLSFADLPSNPIT
ncbi:MAG: cell division protein FtsW [Verrucomicrobia bacterium]|nr:cell division protein FtsW [Verrucomicrobiota bacterium]